MLWCVRVLVLACAFASQWLSVSSPAKGDGGAAALEVMGSETKACLASTRPVQVPNMNGEKEGRIGY